MGALLGLMPLLNSLVALFPNAEQRGAATKAIQDFESQVAAAQSQTNTAEAGSGSLFISGWRPFVGWICALGFAWSIALPVIHGQPLDTDTLNSLLYGLLGLGTWRTAEKIGGAATSAIRGIFK